jgi:hypothetical protein
MEMYSLTPKGQIIAKNPNGVSDPRHPDFAKWSILYKLKFLHYADRNTLATNCGISPEACSLALASLVQRNMVVSDSKRDNASDFI